MCVHTVHMCVRDNASHIWAHIHGQYGKERLLQATDHSCYYYCTADNKLAAVQSSIDGEEEDEEGGWGDDEDLDIDEGMNCDHLFTIRVGNCPDTDFSIRNSIW